MSTAVATLEILPASRADEIQKQELQKAMEVLTKSKAVIVTNQDEYSQADAAIAAIKGAMKAAEGKRLEMVKPLKDYTSRVDAGFRQIKTVFEDALRFYQLPMSAFQAKLAEERRKAEEDARRERERIEREEAAKIEAARKAEDEARRAAEAAQQVADPFEAALAEQEADDAAAAAQQVAEEAKQAIRNVATIPVAAPPKVTGSASKTYEVWKFEITDPALVPLAYRPIDTAAIARDVKAGKGECNIPGVRVYSEIEVK